MKQFFSLKWKLGLSFFLISILLVAAYVTMATQLFENDKLSYVVDYSQLQVESVAEKINQHLEQVLFESKSLWASYNSESGKLSPLGENYLEENKQLLAIGVVFPDKQKSSIFIRKKNVSTDILEAIAQLKNEEATERNDAFGLSIRKLNLKNKLVFRIRLDLDRTPPKSDGNRVNKSYIETYADLTSVLPIQFGQGLLLLTHGEEIYSRIGDASVSATDLQDFVKLKFGESSNKSEFHKIGSVEYLTSMAQVQTGGLKLIYLEDRELVLGALKVLFHRSILFIVMSFFAIIFISVFSSGALTRNLSLLTAASLEIGKGNLDYKVEVHSRDEVGFLAVTFQQMIEQIKKLLRETEEKVRMEQELHTASWVQESLSPKLRRFEKGVLRFAGDHMASTECSGDWWHYFERDEYLFIIIGDATGHGTSAALVTAASRAVFSHLETTHCTLTEMAESWNRAVFNGSLQKLFMTAQLLQINTLSGKYKIINLSHEPPFQLKFENKEAGQKLAMDSVSLETFSPLGRSLNIHVQEEEGTLGPGEMMMLYTDGLFAIENAEGNKMTERKFIKRMTQSVSSQMSAEVALDNIFSIVKDFRKGEVLSDDIAVLVVERKDCSLG